MDLRLNTELLLSEYCACIKTRFHFILPDPYINVFSAFSSAVIALLSILRGFFSKLLTIFCNDFRSNRFLQNRAVK